VIKTLLLTLLPALALAGPVGHADYDGDGRAEEFMQTDSGLYFGKQLITECDESFPCDVSVIDSRTNDGFQELKVCVSGMRDDVSCKLWTVRAGKAVALPFTAPSLAVYAADITVSGSGIVLVDEDDRFMTTRHKFVLSKDGMKLQLVPQPFWYVGYDLHVDRTFPITVEPGAGTTVANVRPNSDIQVVVESAVKPGNYLVKISSGLTGWVSMDTLMGSCDQFMALMSAG
jgi:hypothetical protein